MQTKHASLPQLIDCEYVYPKYAVAYLLTELEKESRIGLFVENNTTHAVPLLLKTLKEQGLEPEQVLYLIITHVHLDHAGGSSALIQACPNATLLAHPRAARHIIDPSKLVQSASQVYGEENFKKLYGQIHPIPSQRVRTVEDGEEIRFGSRTLRFIHTRGHANHHFCIYDSGSEGIFTGDSFGIAYPALQKNGLFIFPSSSPTDFDPIEARLSIQKIVDSGAKRAFLTHFGEVSHLKKAADQLLARLDFHEELLGRAKARNASAESSTSSLVEYCKDELKKYFSDELMKSGMGSDHYAWQILASDIELNAAGIAYVAQK